jgi:uncharacterized membrane protein
MAGMTLIVVARALHIVASVVWAGFVIVIAVAIVGTPRGDSPIDARRIRQSVVSRGARIVAPAAVVSLLSGLYLFATVHAGAHSFTETLLALGAASAVLSFFVGAVGSGPAERRLARLDQATAAGTRSERDAQTVLKFNQRVVITARLTALLLLIATLAMAIARYV